MLKRFGYSTARPQGLRARAAVSGVLAARPVLRLDRVRLGSEPSLAQANIRGLLDAVPPYFSQGVITSDRRTATLAFGIRFMPLDQQQRVIDEMRRRLRPPAGG